MDSNQYLSPRLRNAFAAFAAIAGLIGVAVALLTAPSGIRTVTLVLLFGVALVLVIKVAIPIVLTYYRGSHALPSDIDLDIVSAAYRVEQATSDEIRWIAELESFVYSKDDAIPEHLLREWFSVNHTGFSIVKTADGKPVGHLDILSLRPATLDAFLKGDIIEREIRGDSLYSVDDRRLIKHLYVESIILRPPKPLSNAAAIMSVLSHMASIIERVADLETVERIYAIAATPAGERVMRRLGFELLSAGDRRNDGHDLFAAQRSVLAGKVLAICGSRAIEADDIKTLTKCI